MAFSIEIFRSVEDIWAIWLAGAAVLSWLIARAGRRRRWPTFRSLLKEENGASYALPYVLTFPIYLLLICVFIQATMILMVKMGTVYAAYAAARSAAVWRSAVTGSGDQTDNQRYDCAVTMAGRAAALAMVPMASSFVEHQKAVSLNAFARAAVTLDAATLNSQYFPVYEKLQRLNAERDRQHPPPWISAAEFSGPASKTYVRNKITYALLATSVNLDTPNNEFNAPVKAEVRFVMPMTIPGAGRILGSGPASTFYARTIISTATLPLETPLSNDKQLGIPYASAAN